MSEPVLRPYDPTLRDRIAQALMPKDGKMSPEARRFIEGLMGTDGLGNEKPGLLDVTPLSGLFALDSARRSYISERNM